MPWIRTTVGPLPATRDRAVTVQVDLVGLEVLATQRP